jgi:hypothetical protein
MPRVDRIKIVPHTHPQDFSTVYLCQFAVDGVPCVPFWSHKAERERLGEDAWYRSLQDNAVGMLAEHGPAPALT